MEFILQKFMTQQHKFCEFMYVANIYKHVLLLLVGYKRAAILLFGGWRVVGLGCMRF